MIYFDTTFCVLYTLSVITMIRLVFSVFVFIAVMFFSFASVSAQGSGLIQSDYERYAQLFKIGEEPNMSHHPTEGSATWRKLYRDHHWKDYAEGDEFNKPIVAAQVLMGIYLASYVDHELTYEIDSIIRHKAHFTNALNEYIVLNRVDVYMNKRDKSGQSGSEQSEGSSSLSDLIENVIGKKAGRGTTFYSEQERETMENMGIDLDVAARRRMVSGALITSRQRAEIRQINNLFRQDTKEWTKEWVATYDYMREKFLVLDALRDCFAYHWDSERREEELNKQREDDEVRRAAISIVANQTAQQKRNAEFAVELARYRRSQEKKDEILTGALARQLSKGALATNEGTTDGVDLYEGQYTEIPDYESMVMTEEEIQTMTDYMINKIAEHEVQKIEERHKAFRYLAGVYRSTDYHLETLQKIHRYLLNGATQGDAIAQYHLALFLRYLGEFLDIDKGEAEHDSQEWLTKANRSDLAKTRVAALGSYFLRESNEEEKRTTAMKKKVDALMKVEEEKMELIEEVLERVLGEIGSSKSGSSSSSRGRGRRGD